MAAALECVCARVCGYRYVPLGLAAWFAGQGIKGNVVELDWWEEASHGGTLTIAFTPAQVRKCGRALQMPCVKTFTASCDVQLVVVGGHTPAKAYV
jgi:L-ascorbate metabolism protein UlaG (beta-lactamase superfamily)